MEPRRNWTQMNGAGGGELHRDGQGTGGQTDKFLELLPDKRKIKQSNPLGQEQDS